MIKRYNDFLSESIKLVDPKKRDKQTWDIDGQTIELDNSYDHLMGNNRYIEIYKDDNKIGYLVLSDDEFEHLDFEDQLSGNIVYLSFIRTHESGFLREIITELTAMLKPDYDFIVMQVDPTDKETFLTLQSKYKAVGFQEISPEDFYEYDWGMDPDLDPADYNIFMFRNLSHNLHL